MTKETEYGCSYEQVKEALYTVDCSALEYDDWIAIGMALKSENEDYKSLWDQWAADTDAYRYAENEEGETDIKWESFKGSGVTMGTFWHYVKTYGNYDPIKKKKTEYDWKYHDDGTVTITERGDMDTIPQYYNPIPAVKYGWKPLDDLRDYIEILFQDEDIIRYNLDSEYLAKKGKYRPKGAGKAIKARELLDRIDEYSGQDNAGIESVLGSYDHNAGAWVRLNPFNENGIKDKDVTAYRFTLVESDDMEIEAQYDRLLRLNLPIACIVHSGGKSLHAVVHVDARNEKQYDERVRFIHKACETHGIIIDKANKNPSRLSRLPGCYRGENKQYLVTKEIGTDSYEEWETWYKENNDDLPDIENYSSVLDDMPPLADELIADVLRVGHKLLISGGSKTGKSMLLIQLALAIASGGTWLDMPCRQGKILYVNLEIDRASFVRRIAEAMEIRGISKKDIGDRLQVWNLRGKTMTLDRLVDKVILRSRKGEYAAVIIDPIYKVMMGDENKAGDMSHFCNQFDKLAERGCSVLYAHHFAKGEQKDKASIDRASGSGVFARDPDAILTVTSIESDCDDPAVRVEFTLREFGDKDPINAYYRYPVHVVDTEGKLKYSGIKSAMAEKKSHDDALEEFADAIETGYDILSENGTKQVSQPQLIEYMNMERTKFIRWFREARRKRLHTLKKNARKNKITGEPAWITRDPTRVESLENDDDEDDDE